MSVWKVFCAVALGTAFFFAGYNVGKQAIDHEQYKNGYRQGFDDGEIDAFSSACEDQICFNEDHAP